MRRFIILFSILLSALLSTQVYGQWGSGRGAATATSKGIWYLPPIQVAVDTANTLAADTTWFWQNTIGTSITIDSTHVNASADNYVIKFVERNPNGGVAVLIDQVTASTNGTNTFYITDASVTAPTIESLHWIGFVRPTAAAETVYFRIHYH